MPILECNQLSKSYGKVPALDGVSFAIEPGRIVGLLGPNGSGKTTLIKLANGLLTPSSGEILIDGRTPGRETHAMVSYLPERTAIPTWMSAGQLMDFYEDFYRDFRRQAAEEMLHRLDIQPGQRILVKVLDVDRSDRDHVQVSASVKQAGENPYEKALRRYSVGNRYVGTVSMVDVNGVFVALDGGIDCLCTYPKRGRPPRGARATVRILGINHENNRIWGVITHMSTTR